MLITKPQKINRFISCFVLTVALGFSGASEARLVNVGKGLINDTDLNVTWLKDANLFYSLSGKGSKPRKAAKLISAIIATVPILADNVETHNVSKDDFNPKNGQMSWWGAQAWVDYLNSIHYKGFSDWRLPVLTPVNGSEFNCIASHDGTTDYGYNNTLVNTTASELAHVFYQELRNVGEVTPSGSLRSKGYGLKKRGPFSSLRKGIYWSGTTFPLYADAGDMWHFDTKNGGQGNDQKRHQYYVWVVRTGLANKAFRK